MKLPAAERALIAPAKIRDYLLSTSHPVGRFKAPVFLPPRLREDLFRELDTVLESAAKVLLVVDDYPDWLDVLEYVGLRRKPEIRLLLSARSSVHDVMIDRLCAVLGHPGIAELSADRLIDQDLAWVADFFRLRMGSTIGKMWYA